MVLGFSEPGFSWGWDNYLHKSQIICQGERLCKKNIKAVEF